MRISLLAAVVALSPAFTAAGALAQAPLAPPVAAPLPAQTAPDAGAAPQHGMTEEEAAPPAEPEVTETPRLRTPPSTPSPAVTRDVAPPERARGEHVVAAHETLGGIAHHYGISTGALAAANGITRITPIRIGQHLVVPAPGETVKIPTRIHVVADGNTLAWIARRYASTPDLILAANHLKKHERLHLGQKLVIPGSTGAEAPPESTDDKEPTSFAPDTGIQELPVPGSAPAYYYEPTGPGRAGMKPVIVYLHGRGAEPKHYCERWSHVARNLGWLVCPSGPEDRGDGKRGWNNSWPMGRNVVMAAIEGLRKRYGRRVQLYGNTLIGFSEGAFVAMNVGLREAHTFNRWLILGADTDYWGAAGLATLPEARGRVRKVYLITGGHDDVVNDAAQVKRWLTDAGVPVRVSTPHDMGHEVALESKPAMYQAALRWLGQG